MDSNVEIPTRRECVNLSTIKGDAKTIKNGKPLGSLLDIQPWISTFKRMCITDQFSVTSLNNLMTYFIRNIRSSVNECQTKPLRADKLRSFISESLLFFLYYHRAQEEKYDDVTYMNLMSDLLATYIDTELKASKRSNECHERISGRIVSYLYIYLGDSAEYLLDTLFKIRFMSSNYHRILHPVIFKIFKLIPDHPTSSLMYVRYFLIYRIWKRITKNQNAKNEINSKAMVSLCSPPTSFPQYIMDYVLPKVPNTHTITSRYLFQQPIELEKSCESFVQFCRQSRCLKSAVEMEHTLSDNIVQSFKLEDKIPSKLCLSINKNPAINNSLSPLDSSKQLNVQLNSEKREIISKLSRKSIIKKPQSLSSSASSLSSSFGSVMLIDLTSDDSPDRIVKRKTKINQKRLSWTRSLFKRDLTVTTVTDNNNENSANITEDSQRFEDIHKNNLHAAVADSDSNWMNGLELTSSEMAKLNLPITIESPMKIDELTTINQLYEENTEELTVIGDTDTNELSPLDSINEINSQIASKEILVENIGEKPTAPTLQSPVNIIEKAKVEVTTSDLNIGNATSQSSNNRFNIKYNESLFEEKSATSDSNIKDGIKVNPMVSPTNSYSDLTGPTSDTVLQINECLQSTNIKHDEGDSLKIQEVELHEHIDGLSLLASVSQQVSHLTTTPQTQNTTREVIKVKDYSSLINYESDIGNSESKEILNENKSMDISSSAVNIFSDDDIDKVALHVEVTSSDDAFDTSCTKTSYKQETISNYGSLNNEQSNEFPITSMQVESSIQLEKDDTNVILNGETIVLLQKSPNSNLYIINKAAVENKEHNECNDENNLIEQNQSLDTVNDEMYSYEIYDSMYRIGQPASSKTSYESAQNNSDSARTTSKDLKKTSNKKSNEVISPRRRRVKQEFNGFTNGTCQDLVDAHPLHIPSPTSLYHSNYAPGDLFISCRQNCKSVGCGMPVNHPAAPIHSHNKSTTCSCLNCAYDIVAHCGQCILPSGDSKTKSQIDNSYYIPLQKQTVIQDCSLNKKYNNENIVEMYDEKLLCKIETIDNDKSTKIYQPEVNSKLPLKKRFKSMSLNFTETSIKKEKSASNYPSTPMISIAALEQRENIESSSKLITHQINSKDIICNGYNSEILNSYRNHQDVDVCSGGGVGGGVEEGDGKRKCAEMQEFSLENMSNELKRSNGQLARPLKKVKEQKSAVKKATRRTRSSQRQVPKINYSYVDVDCEWNPSGETKRKRKKANR